MGLLRGDVPHFYTPLKLMPMGTEHQFGSNKIMMRSREYFDEEIGELILRRDKGKMYNS